MAKYLVQYFSTRKKNMSKLTCKIFTGTNMNELPAKYKSHMCIQDSIELMYHRWPQIMSFHFNKS